ncbi:MAG: hypothetical protein E7062_07965 [Spirochaetaceae bacterium]|nr:hypothetical protein [Spirochaetaceae bacterium]
MKKIVTTIAALAMAVSMFAADVSAKVQLQGNLLTVDNGNITALDINKPSDQHWNPIMNFAFSGDKAGAEFVILSGSSEKAGGWNTGFGVHARNFKIWMKPADSFKLIFGLNSFNLNQETITWSKTYSGIEDFGYSINFASNGFGLDLMFAPGWGNPWFSKPKDGDAAIAKTGIKAEYAADFGKINGILVAEDTFKDLKFGAGYNNTFGGVNMFANVLGFTADKEMDALRFEIWASGAVDALSWKVFPAVNVGLAGDKAITLLLNARVDYALDGFNAYLEIGPDSRNQFNYAGVGQGTYFGLSNSKAMNMTIKPGVNGNLGGASWDVSVLFDITKGQEVLVKVPVEFSMGF